MSASVAKEAAGYKVQRGKVKFIPSQTKSLVDSKCVIDRREAMNHCTD